jgi:D-threo-aldose 1-dehydrogenase
VRRLQAVCDAHGVPLRAAALQYTRACPAAAGLVVGARTPAEVDDAAAMLRHPIAPGFWAALREAGLIPN